jgi:hypothetical protein
MSHDSVHETDDLVDRVHGWSGHKRVFSPRQIHIAAAVLAQYGWIAPLAKSSAE